MGKRVRDHIPLEQGLRLYYSRVLGSRNYRQRPYSIRTRIKTVSSFFRFGLWRGVSETIFH